MSSPNSVAGNLFELEYPQSVGVYDSYEAAQKVIDFLADAKFPVQNLAIVGTELRSVERVLGRRTWGTVVLGGVQNGITTGVIIGLLFMFLGAENIFVLFLYALAIGVIVGVVFAALAYWAARGKRDFTSVSQTVATKYEVLAEHKVAGQARELVRTMPGAVAAMFNPPAPQAGAYPGYPVPGYPPQAYPSAGYTAPGYGEPSAGAAYPGQEAPQPGYQQQPPADQPPAAQPPQ